MFFAIIGSLSLFCIVILYILLIFGVPLGEYALGGKYLVLPTKMRWISLLSVLIQLLAIILLLQGVELIPQVLSQEVSRGLSLSFAIFFVLNTIMNAFSASKKEKTIMTPLSFVIAVCFWITVL